MARRQRKVHLQTANGTELPSCRSIPSRERRKHQRLVSRSHPVPHLQTYRRNDGHRPSRTTPLPSRSGVPSWSRHWIRSTRDPRACRARQRLPLNDLKNSLRQVRRLWLPQTHQHMPISDLAWMTVRQSSSFARSLTCAKEQIWHNNTSIYKARTVSKHTESEAIARVYDAGSQRHVVCKV